MCRKGFSEAGGTGGAHLEQNAAQGYMVYLCPRIFPRHKGSQQRGGAALRTAVTHRDVTIAYGLVPSLGLQKVREMCSLLGK